MNMRALNLLLLAPALALTGCGRGDVDRDLVVSTIDDTDQEVSAIGTRLDASDATLRMSLAQGLVTLDEEGRVVPGIAARWIVTEDARSYIFRLRPIRWSDGEDITAKDVARLLRERLTELDGSRLNGQLQEVTSIRSMTGQVIEIELRRPRPDFLQFLAQPEFGLFKGRSGVGPMVVAMEKPLTLRLADTSIERFELDEEASRDSLILYKAEPAAEAISRFEQGYSDLVLNGRFQHLPLVAAAGQDGTVLRFDPVAGLFGLRFLRTDDFWSDVRHRRALALAIDRPALLASFPVQAWQERLKIVPDALDVEAIPTLPEWTQLSIANRREEARTALQDAPPTPLRLWLPPGPGSQILLLRLQADLATVGLRVVRVADRAQAHAELLDVIAPYDDQRWFLAQFSCASTQVCTEDADAALEQADAAQSVEDQRRLYARTEQLMVRQYNYIPLAVPVRWSLVRPDRAGFAVNQRGWHPLHPMIGLPIS